MTRAAPRAAAMKGAVQGAATTTASTPVKKAPAGPDRRTTEAPPTDWSVHRSRTRPTGSGRRPASAGPGPRPRPATAAGSPSRPPVRPRAGSAGRRPGARKVASTPARKASPSRRASAGSCAEPASDAAFIASTGKTQGIRFRISPPSRANRAARPAMSQSKPVWADASAVERPSPPPAPARGAPGMARISQAPASVARMPATGPQTP